MTKIVFLFKLIVIYEYKKVKKLEKRTRIIILWFVFNYVYCNTNKN
jgi:hypothetical protein